MNPELSINSELWYYRGNLVCHSSGGSSGGAKAHYQADLAAPFLKA
jgi:hypothetical protein